MRLARNLLLLLVLLAAIAAAAGVIWRHLALETAAKLTLERYGFGQAALTVEEVGFRRIVASRLSLGPGLPALARVEIEFRPLRLLAGEVEGVRLIGFRGTVEGDGGNLRSLLESFSDRAGAAGGEAAGSGGRVDRGRADRGGLVLPSVTIDDAVFLLRGTPAGDGEVRLDGDLTLAGRDVGVNLQAVLETGFADTRLTLQTVDGPAGLVLKVAASGSADAARLKASPALAAAAGQWLLSGQADFALTAEAALTAVSAERPPDVAALLAGRVQGAGHVSFQGIRTAFAPETADGALAWTLEGEAGQWRWDVPEPGTVTIAGIGDDRWRALGLTLPGGEPLHLEIGPASGTAAIGDGGGLAAWDGEGGLAARAGGASVALSAAVAGRGDSHAVEVASARLHVADAPFLHAGASGLVEKLVLDAAGTVRLPDALDLKGRTEGRVTGVSAAQGTLAAAGFSGAFTAEGAPGAVAVEGTAIAAELTGLTLPGLARVPGPLTVTGERVRFAGGRLEAAVAAGEGQANVLAGGGVKAVPVAWEAISAALTVDDVTGGAPVPGGRVTVTGASGAVPGAGVAVSGANISLPLADGALSVSLRLSDQSGQQRFAPVLLALEGERQGQAVDASGGASMHGGRASVPLVLAADIGAKSADIRFGPSVLAFAPGQMQPSDLSSNGRKAKQVTGNVRLSGRAVIGAESQPAMTAKVGFDDLSAVLEGGVTIDGLNGELAFASLQPPATPGEQRLTVRRLVAGVPLEDADARFTIRPDRDGFAIDLSEAGAKLSGGQVRVGRALFRNGSADLRVGIADLPLERLLEDWKVQGLEGTGMIAGSLPVALRPTGVAIGDGRLLSLTPGVIRVDFGSARQTLAGAGSQLELAVQTLENFHYERMTLGVSKPLGGELTLAVGLNGKNPDVLDGYPFRFNVNLSGRLEPILEAIQAGERIGTDLLQGGITQ